MPLEEVKLIMLCLKSMKIATNYCFRFQYVALQITALLKLDSEPLVRRVLLNLPNGLPNTYLRILEGIPSDKKEQALTALTWLVYSVRPLSLSELAAASSIDPNREPPIIEERVLFTSDSILTIPAKPGIPIQTRSGSPYTTCFLSRFGIILQNIGQRILRNWLNHLRVFRILR
jgi:hypothetical protein